jgi:3-isopropylmalate/(R)-2-methylmalate dehydratase small subunit
MTMPAPLTRLYGIALPLLRDNIDTDELVPVWENARTSSVGFGDALFASHRYLDGPAHTPDPSFILNQPPYTQARILLAGGNFGCGSSRETAAWALRDFGIHAVLAISFNETFQRNCIINGIAPLAVSGEDAEYLARVILHDPARGLTVDVREGLVWEGKVAPEGPVVTRAIATKLDAFYRELLLTGRTEDELLAELKPRIDALRVSRRAGAPWLLAADPEDAGG